MSSAPTTRLRHAFGAPWFAHIGCPPDRALSCPRAIRAAIQSDVTSETDTAKNVTYWVTLFTACLRHPRHAFCTPWFARIGRPPDRALSCPHAIRVAIQNDATSETDTAKSVTYWVTLFTACLRHPRHAFCTPWFARIGRPPDRALNCPRAIRAATQSDVTPLKNRSSFFVLVLVLGISRKISRKERTRTSKRTRTMAEGLTSP
jgi:hypothetical protein